MSTTHRSFKLNAIITDRDAKYDSATRYEAMFGWARGEGPTAAYACGELAGKIQHGIIDWRRPELATFGGRIAIVYTRPDGGAGYDLCRESGTTTVTSVTSPPAGQTGAEAEWQAARKAAWRSVVQAGTDVQDGRSVWAGHAALVDAGYSDLAQEHLRWVGWQRAYRHAEQNPPRAHLTTNLDLYHYATEHAGQHIPAPAESFGP